MSARLMDLVGGLSRLADLGFGLQAGESMRSAALASLLSGMLGLPAEEARAAVYTALLHHVGCVGFAHETASAYGDEHRLNRAAARTDLANVPVDVVATFIPTLTEGLPLTERVRLGATALVKGRHLGDAYTTATCEVGRHAARRLGLGEEVQRGVYHVYEQWAGGGVPDRLVGHEIPIASRLARLAGTAALFGTLGGAPVAVEAIRRRSGGMLDPTLAEAFVGSAGDLLTAVDRGDPLRMVLDAEPEPSAAPASRDLRVAARVFGDLADLKSPYLHGHSRGVSRLARAAGGHLGMENDHLDALEIAALLHDVGRVAVSTRIWEKPGALTRAEWEEVRLHAYHSERILAGTDDLADLAQIAGMHHERLDGGGYHRAAAGAHITPAARVLAAADVYHAMTEPRPHRPARSQDEASRELESEARAGRLDPGAVEAVLAAAGHAVAVRAPDPPAGLTEREVAVLALVADGCSNADIARRLVISRRTAEHHVQNIYAKLGTSSRAAAAVFALEHDLLRRR